ncbi:MAG: DUF4212 domain-containing protein [Pseudomonadota bacterium]
MVEQPLSSTAYAAPPSSADTVYWRRTRQLTVILLSIWLTSTVGIVVFARELSTIHVFGWRLSFYMAAQGSVLINLGIVAFYAWRMGRLDRETLQHLSDTAK